ncbi:MAG TPA: competence/damage-inducible protein A [Solirubrobacteraceae bacterium]|nr:competence/damage-inducible protein A [Solirubrobacteraceae bacterium]
MPARAGIVVTGTEVLTGRVTDRNGPWLSDRLRELGVDLETIIIVGDRPQDMERALGHLAGEGCELIVTSGGLGPTADDLTAEVVGRFQGREMVLDEALRGRIATVLEGIARRWPRIDLAALEEGNRKQATIPRGATILEPVGTAPGLVVTPSDGRTTPAVVVLPGPPRELQGMWPAAVITDAFRRAITGHTEYRQQMLRMFGIPESEIAETLRRARAAGIPLDELEITTCLRRGEVEVVTRYEPPAQGAYDRFAAFVRERHVDTLFSDDGTSVDDQIAALLRRPPARTVAVAESCTGGLLSARLTEPPGASEVVLGGAVVYSNAAKSALADVAPELIERHGAVSIEVACALADGAIERFGADIGVGVTGIAGPAGGSEDKPVGTVCLSVAERDGRRIDRRAHLPGARADVRDRATTVALHLLRRLLLGLGDLPTG